MKPILRTKRLILRFWEQKDEKDLVTYMNDIEVTRYLVPAPHPYKLKDARWWIAKCTHEVKRNLNRDYNFCIELKSNKRVIGGLGLHDVEKKDGNAEIGYCLAKEYWKQGLMTEAASALITFGFKKLKLRRIYAPIFKENKASQKLVEKLGFKKEGLLRKHAKSKATGKVHDCYVYGLLKGEWKKK